VEFRNFNEATSLKANQRTVIGGYSSCSIHSILFDHTSLFDSHKLDVFNRLPFGSNKWSAKVGRL